MADNYPLDNAELTPETREETFLDGVTELEPETRKEAFIAKIYDSSQVVPEHIETREEWFLNKAAEGGGGVTIEALSVTANGIYSEAGKAYSPVTVEVPLPTNANERKSVTSYPVTDSAIYPLPKCDVTVTDADKCEVIVTTDNTITEDSGVYLDRQSGGGSRELDEIVGGSIVWNQLVKETDTSCTVQSGHKYVLKQGSTYTVVVSDGTAFTVDGSVNDNVYDLTALFGSTIADYIYSLEQSTAGSGIAWLKSYGYLTEDYYGYTANKIESVSVARHITRGKNLFDNSPYSAWYISNDYAILQNHLPKDTGLTISFTDRDTSVDISGCYLGFIESGVVSNPSTSQYKWVINNGVAQTDTNSPRNYQNKYLSDLMIYPKTQEVYDKIFSRFYVQIEYGTTATAYEPYHAPHTYPINPITLRGIPKLNASNQLYYDGDRYEASGRVTRKYGIVDLGTLNWSKTGDYFVVVGSDLPPNFGFQSYSYRQAGNLVCSHYITVAWIAWSSSDKVIGLNDTYFGIKDSTYASYSSSDFKTAMSGVYLVYELATPTTEYTSPFEANQIVDANGTEEYIDAGVEAGTRDVAIPVGHDTKYFNGKAYVKPLTAGTSDTISMADMGIMPTSPMYIEANGTLDVEYWKSNS